MKQVLCGPSHSQSVLRCQPLQRHVQHDGVVGNEQVDPRFAAGGGGVDGGSGAVVQRGGLFLLHGVGVEVARLLGMVNVVVGQVHAWLQI